MGFNGGPGPREALGHTAGPRAGMWAPDTPPNSRPRPGAQGPGRWRRGGRGPTAGSGLRTRARGEARPPGGVGRWVEADPYLLQSGSHGVAVGPEAGAAPVHRCGQETRNTPPESDRHSSRRGELHRPGAIPPPALRTRRLWNLREVPPPAPEAPPRP